MLKLAILVSVLSIVVLSLSGSSMAPSRAQTDATPGEVLVTLDQAAWSHGLEAIEQTLGGRVIDILPEIRTVRLALTPRESIEDAIGRIKRLPGVEGAEANLRLRETRPADDTFYGGQAGYLELIQAPEAWVVTSGDDSVIVAVLDSGVDIDHPDLAGKIWANPLEIDGNAVDDDENGCVDDMHGCNFVTLTTTDPSCAAPLPNIVTDDNGHGTFVSGIIAAVANNAAGITGAAPGVTILPVKILDCLGGGSAADAAKGILYAARVGARVANISFSGNGESQTLASAIREAHDHYGMVIVAASGNEGTKGVTFPARLPEAISVGSSGAAAGRDLRSPFSDWGPEVDVVAPGLDIISTVPAAMCGEHWHCINEQPYANASGTSFAAPLVSSLAALIISFNPNLSPETVRWMILRSAAALPDGDTPSWDGAGRIRMRAALDMPRFQIGAPGSIRQ